MSSKSEFLWYIPNEVRSGHRGDCVVENHNSLQTLASHAKALEDNGWKG
ncbi:LLM class flavin-dependent oxidoreductase, partial [Mesorhizobium sp. BHbdii]